MSRVSLRVDISCWKGIRYNFLGKIWFKKRHKFKGWDVDPHYRFPRTISDIVMLKSIFRLRLKKFYVVHRRRRFVFVPELSETNWINQFFNMGASCGAVDQATTRPSASVDTFVQHPSQNQGYIVRTEDMHMPYQRNYYYIVSLVTNPRINPYAGTLIWSYP